MANYVDKEALYDDIVNWQDAVASAQAAGVEPPIMPNSVGAAILEIANGMATRWNFRDYSWIDEMVGDGIEAATRAVAKFDRGHEKRNPFGFLTFVIWRAFVTRLKLEKKLHEDKMKMMLDETFEGYERGEFDDNELSKTGMIGLYALND